MVIKMKNYSINEVSEILNIPKSTLRYWESEKLITCQHNDNNDYREYTTEDLILIADIAFYRSLNIPIKSLHNIYHLSYAHYLEFLQASYQKVDNEIINLIQTKEKIAKRMHAIETFQSLAIGNTPNQKPFFNQIKHINFREKKNVLPYLDNQNILAMYFQPTQAQLDIRGIVSDDLERSENTLWLINEAYEYIPCLIKVTNLNIDISHLTPLFQQIEKQHKHVNGIVGNYLITDKENDFYQGWIEIIP